MDGLVSLRLALRAALCAFLGVAAMGVAATQAHAAAGVSMSGGVLTVAADGADDSLDVRWTDSAKTVLRVQDTGAGGATNGGGCSQGSSQQVTCSGFTSVVIDLGSGNDTLNLDEAVNVPVSSDGGLGDDRMTSVGTLHGGAGNDQLKGIDGTSEQLYGDDGDDKLNGQGGGDLLDGGPGNDALMGGSGADEIHGGEGDDALKGESPFEHTLPQSGTDVLDGGPGNDTVDYTSRDDGLSISLDGLANDGAPGESDNLLAVEVVAGGSGADTMTGSTGPDQLHGGVGSDTIDGGGGDDIVDGEGSNDVVNGGPGDDIVLGGGADDTVDGGPGADRISGDSQQDVGISDGADTIKARDGEADRVDCNGGADVAVLDEKDIAGESGGLNSCESIDRAAVAHGGGGGGGPAAGGISVASVKAGHHGKLTLTLRVPGAGSAVASASVKKQAGFLATGSGKIHQAGTVAVKLRATKVGKRALKKKRAVKVMVRATFIPAGAKKGVTVKKRATLRR